MEFIALTEDILFDARAEWSQAGGGEFYTNSIDYIIESSSYGDITTRTNFESTYYGIRGKDDGRLLGLLQFVVSGGGKTKTIKLLDLTLAPGMHKSSKSDRVNVVICAVEGILNASSKLESCGNRLRVAKIYGRTKEILGVLEVLAEELADSAEEIGAGVTMEGGWLAFYPIEN